ncbi:MAG: hypothetical protein ACREHV_11430 [Rhizomicrobium sp.]
MGIVGGEVRRGVAGFETRKGVFEIEDRVGNFRPPGEGTPVLDFLGSPACGVRQGLFARIAEYPAQIGDVIRSVVFDERRTISGAFGSTERLILAVVPSWSAMKMGWQRRVLGSSLPECQYQFSGLVDFRTQKCQILHENERTWIDEFGQRVQNTPCRGAVLAGRGGDDG